MTEAEEAEAGPLLAMEPSAVEDGGPIIGDQGHKPKANIVASTDVATLADQSRSANGRREFFYKSAQWSADGTTIICSASDNSVSSFVLPDTLLEPSAEPHALRPTSTLLLPEPSCTAAPAPYFSLQDTTSHLLLAACKDHPIHLHHLFQPAADQPAKPLCGYKLIRRETEEYIVPASLLWLSPGTHFLVGSANRLDYFDVSRSGNDGPFLTVPTIPSRRHRAKGGGVGMKGTVSSLAVQSPDAQGSSLVAAGTRTRWVGLYDLVRLGGSPAANWSIDGVAEAEFGVDIGGSGIVQTIWSPCGRYLVFNERDSTGLLVYDVRVSGRPLSVLAGRTSTTPQRLSCDVFSGENDGGSFEVWAGTEHGEVLVWDDVGAHDGIQERSWDWQAHNAPVGSTTIHSSGSVVATCSGGWTSPSDEELESHSGRLDDTGIPSLAAERITADHSLRIWSLYSD